MSEKFFENLGKTIDQFIALTETSLGKEISSIFKGSGNPVDTRKTQNSPPDSDCGAGSRGCQQTSHVQTGGYMHPIKPEAKSDGLASNPKIVAELIIAARNGATYAQRILQEEGIYW